ncbi:hypothetical protein ACYSNU_07625 [Enterococcus sp. LJL120]
MNKTQVWELFKINLLYANPQTTMQLRKKNRQDKSLTRSLLSQYVLIAVMFAFMYGLIMMSVDYPNYPGFFTFYCLMFGLMSFSQSISILFNVFYDSKDLKDYLPLPYTQASVFMGKFLTVALTVAPFQLPVFVLFCFTAFRSSAAPIINFVIAIVLGLAFFFIILGFSALLVSVLVQSKWFNRHKSVFTTLLMVIPTIGMVAGILYVNSQQTYVYEGVLPDQTPLPPFLPFHMAIVHPFSLGGILSIIGILGVTGLIFVLAIKFVVPRMYNYASGEYTPVLSEKASKKKIAYRSLNRQLMTYNLSLIKNPTLMLQAFSSIALIPLIMLINMMTSGFNLVGISADFWPIAFVIGVFYSAFTINTTSIGSMMISLDGDNFEFIRSLPMNFSDYLKVKFRFAVIVQMILTGLMVLIISLVMQANPLLIIGVLLGDFLGTYLLSCYYFYRDYRLLTTNWTSVSQLFNRGAGTWGMVFIYFGVLIIGGLVTAALGFWLVLTGQTLLITLITLVIFAIITFAVNRHYQKVFWSQDLLN